MEKINSIKNKLNELGIEIPDNIMEYKNIDTKNLKFEWGIDSYRNAIRSKSHHSKSIYKDDIEKILKDLNVECLNPNDYEKAKTNNLQIRCDICQNVYNKSLVLLKQGQRCPLCAKKKADEKKRFINPYEIAKENGYDIEHLSGDDFKCTCEKGHEFVRREDNIKVNKKGCPICQKEKELKSDFGIFTSDDYKGLLNKAHFTCSKCGKTQYTYYGNIRGSKSCRYCIGYNKSNGEKEIIDLIRKYGGNDVEIITNTRKVIEPQELDIYLPKLKIAIEYNGFYWHAQLHKNYHKDKSLKCREQGIRLIHIYDFETLREKELIISSLFIKNNIYARKCDIKEISQSEYKTFCEDNHLMGYRKASILYGLFHEGRLVQIASFSKSNFKGYDYEWIRGCPASVNRVVGGTSKLFVHFLREYKPKNVLCYSDFNKFDGNGYAKIGFKLDGFTVPNKWVLYNGKVIKRNPNKYKEYKNCLNLYGSGSMRFVYESE